MIKCSIRGFHGSGALYCGLNVMRFSLMGTSINLLKSTG